MFEKYLIHVLEIQFKYQCIFDLKQNAANIKARKIGDKRTNYNNK